MEPEDIMYTFDDLKQILEKLRDKENGCPWDSVQTHESMKKYLEIGRASCRERVCLQV